MTTNNANSYNPVNDSSLTINAKITNTPDPTNTNFKSYTTPSSEYHPVITHNTSGCNIISLPTYRTTSTTQINHEVATLIPNSTSPLTEVPAELPIESPSVTPSMATQFSPVTAVVHSNMTSQGKRKASASDPIRSYEHFNMLKEYFLTHGHKNTRIRNYMMVVLGTSLGLRISDLVNIRIGDVINMDGTFKSELLVHERKTKKMNHPIINESSKKAIAMYLNSLSTINLQDYLFKDPSEEGFKPLDKNTPYTILTRANKILKLPYHIGSHTFRRTFAYWTIKLHPHDNTILMALQEMLNHSSMRVTLRYAGLAKQEYYTLYNDVGKFLNEANRDNIVQTATSINSDTEIMQYLDNIYPEDDEE